MSDVMYARNHFKSTSNVRVDHRGTENKNDTYLSLMSCVLLAF